jgi:hypothetical protein
MTHRSLGRFPVQTQQPSAHVDKPGEQCVVVDVSDEWMHDSSAERTGEHGGLDPPVQTRIAQQHLVQTVHEKLKRLVLGQQSDDDGIELQGAHQPAVANGHLNHAHQQGISCLRPVVVCFGLLERRLEPAEFALGHGDDDLFFGPELMVDSSFRYTDGVSDHLQRRTADTVCGEQIQRGIEYPRPGRAVLDQPELITGDRPPCCSHAPRLDDAIDRS